MSCVLSSIPQIIYALSLSHIDAELLNAEIYSPIILGSLLSTLNSSHSLSLGKFLNLLTKLI